MVSATEVHTITTEHFQNRTLTAVFVGATSGIGEYTVRELSKLYSTQQKTSLKVYIVGRNEAAANSIIETCSKVCPNATFRFVLAKDLALINDVDRISNEILRLVQDEHKDALAHIDLLVLTQGRVVFGPRQGMLRTFRSLVQPVTKYRRNHRRP